MKMGCEQTLLLVLFVYIVSVSTAPCEDIPNQQQCLAYNNRFILPRNTNCNPFKEKCRMGDLVDTKVAQCGRMYPGNIQHSLNQRWYVKYGYCSPEFQSIESAGKVLTVSAVVGDLRCAGVKMTESGKFTCGEKGTRCVCYAPPGNLHTLRGFCRCQYFIDYCTIPAVCAHPEAECTTKGSEVTCTCPLRSKTCTSGINQCTVDPGICEAHEKCIELYDHFTFWVVGARQSKDGYACVSRNDMQFLEDATVYCSVGKSYKKAEEKARSHIDACCFHQLICGRNDNKVHGNILSYRPCYCNTLFRKCINRYSKYTTYKELGNTVIRTMNQQTTCEMNEQNKCDPREPTTCRKGDLINPKIAHCQINCKSGPLLPIGQRMCSIRQCKPPFHVSGVRIIDIPNQKTSSLCKAVRRKPYLCGKGDTRCVCDGRPSTVAFTDRCRCQFWPLEI